MQRIDWRELESEVGLEGLPAFHRAFLSARGIADPDALPLRRVQQAVERELNRLVLEGRAEREGEALLVDAAVLVGLPVGRDVVLRLQRARQRP